MVKKYEEWWYTGLKLICWLFIISVGIAIASIMYDCANESAFNVLTTTEEITITDKWIEDRDKWIEGYEYYFSSSDDVIYQMKGKREPKVTNYSETLQNRYRQLQIGSTYKIEIKIRNRYCPLSLSEEQKLDIEVSE